ncbi:MAG: Flp pilus assembly complex ATPase component TadA, partial [Nocardioides sp.]|nr:Flp pilus assembly complex ATPase component TadA [Nocardioides sp.]
MDSTLRDLLQQVVVLEASDLHLRAGAVPKVRRSGALEPLPVPAPAADDLARMLESAMSPDVLDAFARDLEADFAIAAEGIGRFRVNAFLARGAVGAVLRRIGEDPIPLDTLGMPESVGRLALRPRGLVLVTGPTGSGKSTTLSAMVDLVNQTRPVHVLTLEDPIEVVHRDKR